MRENQTKSNANLIAIVTMMFLYAMISFVTNLAAPIGVVTKNDPEVGGSNFLAMMGNFMNFLAYLFMGIPAGMMLTRVGYKKTAMAGVGLGLVGVLVQFISGFEALEGYSDNAVYLLGAFISGLSVCLLNTVVNPMLNLLGGGGKRGNSLNMMGGTFNSLAGTLTPMLVGALIGEVTKETDFVDINLVLYIAMGVFATVLVVLAFVPIKDPEIGKVTSKTKFEHSPWNFRHFVLGAIAVFVYVGIEVGIPGTLNFYLSDITAKGAGLAAANAAIVGGLVAGTYWLLMLVGRIVGVPIAAKVSSKSMMVVATSVAMALILIAMFLDKGITATMPVYTGGGFTTETVPMSAIFLVLCGLCTSVMWTSIFNLATEGLGKYTAAASGIFMMMVVGGGVLPLIQNAIADSTLGYMFSYIVPLIGLAYLCFYALVGCKNVNKDIPVD
ncbi:MAG: MFS transporter [Muribaculaceae bacterium]|nr:MFS transporter [Muribaculaceae bacterium]